MPEWWYWIPAGIVIYLVVSIGVIWCFPALLRTLWWQVVHVLHKFHRYGRERIPATGPVLLISNHVSYLDWLYISVACPRRVTFVLWSKYRENPILAVLLSFVRGRTIEIDTRTTAPHALAGALEQVAAALRADECVLVFPEGRLTRNGQVLPFRRGVEFVIRRVKKPVAVVPVYLWNVWGTLATHKTGRLFFRWPEVFRRRIAVQFGEVLPGNTKIADMRAAVIEAGAECAIAQSEYVIPVHSSFVRYAAQLGNIRRVAIVDATGGADRVLTWPKALVGAWSLASWLNKKLPSAQQNIGVWLPTGLGSAFVNIALAFLKRTSVNLNYTAGPVSVASAIRHAELRTIITARRFVERLPLDVPPGVEVIYLEDALAGISGVSKLLRLIAVLVLPGWFLDRAVLRLRRFRWDDTLTIIFSSGSTGEPKGVMLSLRNVSSNADGFQKGVNFHRDDRMLCTLPFFHSFGYTVCLWAPASIGMMSLYYADPRAAKEVGELAERWKATIALGTATFVRFYVRRCVPANFASVRLFICGAEKLPVSLQQEFEAKFNTPLLEGYGCTEVSPVVGANLPNVSMKGVHQISNKPGSIGQPIPGVVARAYDFEADRPLPSGVEGMLCVRGPNVMKGYLHQPERTAEVMSRGWYITGDIGYVDADGFIFITGRLSRFAKIAGEMVPLERLDDEMHELLALSTERALAVAAVPDARRGERIIVLHLPEYRTQLPGVFEKLRSRGLPNLWIPDARDCIPVDTFPILGNGKLDLKGLSDLARKLTANEAAA